MVVFQNPSVSFHDGGRETEFESESKPGTEMVNPDPRKELIRRPHLFMVGIVPNLHLPEF